MKRLFLLLGAALIAVAPLSAQSQKEIIKERKQVLKMTENELNDKASKSAQKEAKKLKKAGWTVAPGHLPLEKQLDRSYKLQYEVDEQLFPKYIIGDAMSIGEVYDAAKSQALSLAVLNLAGNIQKEVTALVENSVANKQLAAEEAASIVETITASKDIISQSIGRTIPVVECYRTVSHKNKEVRVVIFYNSEAAKGAVKRALRDELAKKGQDLHGKLDKIMGLK